jgi:hypothetical protein
MELSITTLIVFGTLLVCFSGFIGFLLGTFSRIVFRYQFHQYCNQQTSEANKQLQEQIKVAQEYAQNLINTANAQTQQIYKAAAEHAANVKLDVTDLPKGNLN